MVPDPTSMNLPSDLGDGKAGPHTGLGETEAREAGTWMWWSAVGWGWAQGKVSVGTESGRSLFLDPLTLLLGTSGGSADLRRRL